MVAQRIENLQKWMKKENVDGFIVDKPLDIFYLTGQLLSFGRLLVLPHEAYFFVDGRYFEICKKGPLPVYQTQGYKKASVFAKELGKLLPKKGVSIGFDAGETSYSIFQDLKEVISGKESLIPFHSPIERLRMIKDEKELALLKKAANLGSKGFDFVAKHLKTGITEKEMAAKLKNFWLEKGSEEVAFSPIIAFGEGSAFPHYHPKQRKLKQGDIVLIDIGVTLNHYRSDMTRTLFFGKPHPKLLEIYNIVKEAKESAEAICQDGVPIKAVDNAARSFITKAGYGPHFSHGLGHGIGLETHEIPYLRATNEENLSKGMVVTIEPGIYLPV